MESAIGILLVWAISLVILIFIIGAGVRVGMRWSRIDERKERIRRGELVPGHSNTRDDPAPHRTSRTSD